MKFVIDIDGTVCTQAANGDYSEAQPLYTRIQTYNQLYEEGHIIWYYTARGTETGIDWREVTEKQFERWGVLYHKLVFGKPSADVYIDDKALNIKDV